MRSGAKSPYTVPKDDEALREDRRRRNADSLRRRMDAIRMMAASRQHKSHVAPTQEQAEDQTQ